MEPDFIKENHMIRYKKGTFKDTEQFVFCKLKSLGFGHHPEIHGFTDGASTTADFVLKVKRFARVQKSDVVPKIVKAKYENYICITCKGGEVTYLRTDNKEQRDEWCELLRSFLTRGGSERYSQPPTRLRQRLHTDVTSNRQTPSRARTLGATVTAPGTMVGTFHEELERTVRNRDQLPQEVVQDDHSDKWCCPRHHIDAGSHDDGCEENIYMNVHAVPNLDRWRQERMQSRQVLQRQKDLYNTVQMVGNLQSHPEDPLEDEYEVPDTSLVQSIHHQNRWSNSSSSSDEGAHGGPQDLRSTVTIRTREPVESSWPPSSPEESQDEAGPEVPAQSSGHRTGFASGRDSAFQSELASKLSSSMSIHGATNAPWSVHRKLSQTREPEAALCSSPNEEAIYMNNPTVRTRAGTRPTRTDSLRTQPATDSVSDPRDSQTSGPPLPPRRSSSKKITPVLPMRIMDKAAILQKEKMEVTTEICIAKSDLLRYMPCLKHKHDSIIATRVPAELRKYFRVGDQWIKVNDQLLNCVDYAKKCIQMSDNSNVTVTVKRIPYGIVCTFRASGNRRDIGLTLQGPEIVELSLRGLAARQGNLPSRDTNSLSTAGVRCNYAITEVNFNPVDPDASTEQVWEMLQNAGKDVVLILHPVDFLTFQKSQDEDIYEDIH